MGKLRLWPIVRKLAGKAGSFATYVERFPRQQVLLSTYFRYRRYTGRSKYWPNRGQFFKADRFWTAQSIAWRKKWKDAVKKHGLTGYSLWMKEALYHLVRQVNAPENPSNSGGYADPPLNPGERLEPCPPPPPDGDEEPPDGNDEEPPEDPTIPCWICDALDEITPWVYQLILNYEIWPSITCEDCTWYVYQRQEPYSPCVWWAWEWCYDYLGKTEVTYTHLYEMGEYGVSRIHVYNSFYGQTMCEWERKWYVAEMGPVCSYTGDGDFELINEFYGAECGESANVLRWWGWGGERPHWEEPEPPPEEPPPEPPPYGECWICAAKDEPTPSSYSVKFWLDIQGVPTPLVWEHTLHQWERNPCGWVKDWYDSFSGLDYRLLYHHEYEMGPQGFSELWLWCFNWSMELGVWRHYWDTDYPVVCRWTGELDLEFCVGWADCGEAWVEGCGF